MRLIGQQLAEIKIIIICLVYDFNLSLIGLILLCGCYFFFFVARFLLVISLTVVKILGFRFLSKLYLSRNIFISCKFSNYYHKIYNIVLPA